MSVHALSWAFKQDIRPSARKFILVALANYADEEGVCYPSQKTLAADTGQSERSVREHLTGLEEDGVIVRVQRRRENGTWRSDCFQIIQANTQRPLLPEDGEQIENQRQISPAAKVAGGEGVKSRKSAKSTQRQISPAADLACGEKQPSQRQISPSPAADFATHIEEPSLEPSEEPKDSSLRSDAPKTRSKGSRGIRLPADWKPNDQDRIFAQGHGLTESEIDWFAAEFVDFWCGCTGQKATKLDWSATWRNRVRAVVENGRLAKLRASQRPPIATAFGSSHGKRTHEAVSPYLAAVARLNGADSEPVWSPEDGDVIDGFATSRGYGSGGRA